MTKAEFFDWRKDPITQQVFKQLNDRIAILKDEITSGARDADQRELAYKAGAVYAYSDLVNIEYEESHGS